MKELIVKKIKTTFYEDRGTFINFMKPVEWNIIDTVNWKKYDYSPNVQFRIAYCDTAIFLHYKVHESSIRAKTIVDNGEVWKDSCIEFFVMPENDGIYYNFEFNCVGACRLAAGTGRNDREMVPVEVVSQIFRNSSLCNKQLIEEQKIHEPWDMVIGIPYSCFFKHPDYSPTGKTIHANFYKCGDELEKPHFLSWNPINTEKPDFHRPEFFGTLT